MSRKSSRLRAAAQAGHGDGIWDCTAPFNLTVIKGEKGYYDNNGNRCLTNLTYNTSKQLLGCWSYAENPQVNGQFCLTFGKDRKSFDGTWGWNGEAANGGEFSGRWRPMANLRGKGLKAAHKVSFPEYQPAPYVPVGAPTEAAVPTVPAVPQPPAPPRKVQVTKEPVKAEVAAPAKRRRAGGLRKKGRIPADRKCLTCGRGVAENGKTNRWHTHPDGHECDKCGRYRQRNGIPRPKDGGRAARAARKARVKSQYPKDHFPNPTPGRQPSMLTLPQLPGFAPPPSVPQALALPALAPIGGAQEPSPCAPDLEPLPVTEPVPAPVPAPQLPLPLPQIPAPPHPAMLDPRLAFAQQMLGLQQPAETAPAPATKRKEPPQPEADAPAPRVKRQKTGRSPKLEPGQQTLNFSRLPKREPGTQQQQVQAALPTALAPAQQEAQAPAPAPQAQVPAPAPQQPGPVAPQLAQQMAMAQQMTMAQQQQQQQLSPEELEQQSQAAQSPVNIQMNMQQRMAKMQMMFQQRRMQMIMQQQVAAKQMVDEKIEEGRNFAEIKSCLQAEVFKGGMVIQNLRNNILRSRQFQALPPPMRMRYLLMNPQLQSYQVQLQQLGLAQQYVVLLERQALAAQQQLQAEEAQRAAAEAAERARLVAQTRPAEVLIGPADCPYQAEHIHCQGAVAAEVLEMSPDAPDLPQLESARTSVPNTEPATPEKPESPKRKKAGRPRKKAGSKRKPKARGRGRNSRKSQTRRHLVLLEDGTKKKFWRKHLRMAPVEEADPESAEESEPARPQRRSGLALPSILQAAAANGAPSSLPGRQAGFAPRRGTLGAPPLCGPPDWAVASINHGSRMGPLIHDDRATRARAARMAQQEASLAALGIRPMPPPAPRTAEKEGITDLTNEPLGWAKSIDPATGKVFYYNRRTRKTRWDLPPELRPVDDPQMRAHREKIALETTLIRVESDLAADFRIKAEAGEIPMPLPAPQPAQQMEEEEEVEEEELEEIPIEKLEKFPTGEEIAVGTEVIICYPDSEFHGMRGTIEERPEDKPKRKRRKSRRGKKRCHGCETYFSDLWYETEDGGHNCVACYSKANPDIDIPVAGPVKRRKRYRIRGQCADCTTVLSHYWFRTSPDAMETRCFPCFRKTAPGASLQIPDGWKRGDPLPAQIVSATNQPTPETLAAQPLEFEADSAMTSATMSPMPGSRSNSAFTSATMSPCSSVSLSPARELEAELFGEASNDSLATQNVQPEGVQTFLCATCKTDHSPLWFKKRTECLQCYKKSNPEAAIPCLPSWNARRRASASVLSPFPAQKASPRSRSPHMSPAQQAALAAPAVPALLPALDTEELAPPPASLQAPSSGPGPAEELARPPASLAVAPAPPTAPVELAPPPAALCRLPALPSLPMAAPPAMLPSPSHSLEELAPLPTSLAQPALAQPSLAQPSLAQPTGLEQLAPPPLSLARPGPPLTQPTPSLAELAQPPPSLAATEELAPPPASLVAQASQVPLPREQPQSTKRRRSIKDYFSRMSAVRTGHAKIVSRSHVVG